MKKIPYPGPECNRWRSLRLFSLPTLSRRRRIERKPVLLRTDEDTAFLEISDLIEAFGLPVIDKAFRAAAEEARR